MNYLKFQHVKDTNSLNIHDNPLNPLNRTKHPHKILGRSRSNLDQSLLSQVCSNRKTSMFKTNLKTNIQARKEQHQHTFGAEKKRDLLSPLVIPNTDNKPTPNKSSTTSSITIKAEPLVTSSTAVMRSL